MRCPALSSPSSWLVKRTSRRSGGTSQVLAGREPVRTQSSSAQISMQQLHPRGQSTDSHHSLKGKCELLQEWKEHKICVPLIVEPCAAEPCAAQRRNPQHERSFTQLYWRLCVSTHAHFKCKPKWTQVQPTPELPHHVLMQGCLDSFYKETQNRIIPFNHYVFCFFLEKYSLPDKSKRQDPANQCVRVESHPTTPRDVRSCHGFKYIVCLLLNAYILNK